MKLTQKYIHFQKIYGLGEGQLGFIKNIANISGALNILNFIKLYFPEYSHSFLVLAPVFILSYIVMGYAIGKTIDTKLKFVDRQKNWDNARDPAIKEILDRLRGIDRRI